MFGSEIAIQMLDYRINFKYSNIQNQIANLMAIHEKLDSSALKIKNSYEIDALLRELS